MTTTIQLVNAKLGVYWIHPTKFHKNNRLWVGPFRDVAQAMKDARSELGDAVEAELPKRDNDLEFASNILLDKLTGAIDDGIQTLVEKRVLAVKAENARIQKTTADVMRRLSGE